MKAGKPLSKHDEKHERDKVWLARHHDDPDPHIYRKEFNCSKQTAIRRLKELGVAFIDGRWQVGGQELSPATAVAQALLDRLLDEYVDRKNAVYLKDEQTILIRSDADDRDLSKLAQTLRVAWPPLVIMAGEQFGGVHVDAEPDRAQELVALLRGNKK